MIDIKIPTFYDIGGAIRNAFENVTNHFHSRVKELEAIVARQEARIAKLEEDAKDDLEKAIDEFRVQMGMEPGYVPTDVHATGVVSEPGTEHGAHNLLDTLPSME
jgi:hypothetical protein